jgi:AcrR family transcriptional regulator
MSAAASTDAPRSHAQLAHELLRERLLAAVGELLADRSWAHVTMAQVAARAGVSRQTLYNAFGSRRELARAYVEREADRFLAGVDAAVRDHAADPRAALAAALELFLAAAAEHPLVRAITSGDGGEELLALVTTRGRRVIERATAHLTALLLDSWPSLQPDDAAPLADALVRLAISHAALPSSRPVETAAALAQILGPYIDLLLG